MNTHSTAALRIVVSLLLTGIAGAAFVTFADYATRGVIT